LDTNESVCRIHAELLPNPESVTWYSDESPAPSIKIWSLDTPADEANVSQPSARFNGLEVSSETISEPIEQILGKRHAAVEFDQRLSRAKRRRLGDLTPYIALGQRNDQLQILQEFLPRHLVDNWLGTVPAELRAQILRISRSLGQEYRYSILDRIIRSQCMSLGDLALFESLERSMLALHAEKVKVTLKFDLKHSIGDLNHIYDVKVNVSR
jgi:hypothetical protein